MQKFLLFSLLIATIVIPMRAARDRSPSRGLRRMLYGMVAFNVLYLLAVIYVLPRLPA